MQQIKENYWILSLIFIIGLFLVLSVPLLRMNQGNYLTPGEETYFHLNSINGSFESFYDLVLETLATFLSLQIIVILLPLILFLGSSFLLFLIMKQVGVSPVERYVSLAILFLTSSFITIHVGLSIYALILFFSLLTMYAFLKKSKSYILSLIVLYLTSPFVGFIVLVYLLVQTVSDEKHSDSISLFLTLGVGFMLSSFIPFIASPFNNLFLRFLPNELFNFLGGIHGYVFFSFILGLIGVYSFRNISSLSQRLSFTVLLLFSLFNTSIRLILLPFIAFFAAKALVDLMNQKWTLNFLRDFTIILFICMLLFSSLSGVRELVNDNPSLNQKDAFFFLQAVKEKNSDVSTSKVLTDPSYGAYLTYFSKLDSFANSDDLIKSRLAIDLLQSRDFKFISDTFQRHKIAFVFIDQALISGNILQRPDQGLAFIVEHNDNFKLIYSRASEKIYYFTLWNNPDFISN